MKSTLSISLLALVSSTFAHFTLDYPYTRGFDEDNESMGPCGGFKTANATLTPWYYLNGPVEIDSHHDTATVQIFLASSTASTLADFQKNNLTDVISITGQGEFCFKVNASSSTRAVNTNAVLMVEHTSVHGHLYQCSDVVLSSNAQLGSDITCTGALTARPSNDGGDHDEGSSNSTSTSTTASKTNAAMPSDSLPKLSAVIVVMSLIASGVAMLV